MLPPPKQAALHGFCASEKVFLARITAAHPAAETRTSYDVKVVTYDVEKMLKGKEETSGQLYTPRFQGMCGVTFEVGKVALVFVDQNSSTYSCSATLTDARADEAGQYEIAVLEESERLAAQWAKDPDSVCRSRRNGRTSVGTRQGKNTSTYGWLR
jgi:hypothetical protein